MYFSNHAISKMKKRHISRDFCSMVVVRGRQFLDKNGNTKFLYKGITVVLDPRGTVITVYRSDNYNS